VRRRRRARQRLDGTYPQPRVAAASVRAQRDRSIHALTSGRLHLQEKHPSALASFESLLAAAKGKQIVMFLDYDGTLSPIVEDPDRAVMSEEVSSNLRPVFFSSRCKRFLY